MKEPKVDLSQELDAGWDDIASDVTELAAKPAVGDAVAVDELDSGWDLGQGASEARAERTEVREHAPQRATQPSGARSKQAGLAVSKKARRELERQNRTHAAKRRAQAKVQRKEQRRAERQMDVGAQSAHPTNAKSGTPSNLAAHAKRKRRIKREPRIAGPTTTTRPIERPASVEAKEPAAHEMAPAASGKLLWVALSVAAAGIMAIIAKWLFS